MKNPSNLRQYKMRGFENFRILSKFDIKPLTHSGSTFSWTFNDCERVKIPPINIALLLGF